MEVKSIQDEKTQVSGTNDYSIQSKYSLVRKGYIEDIYLDKFVANPYVSRSPIINWGYYVRHCAIQFGLNWITELSSHEQEVPSRIYKNVIVSFGAGFDTLALRNRKLPFIELDYTSVCIRKARIMLQNGLFTQDISSESVNCVFGKNNEQKYCFYPERTSGVIFVTASFILIGVDLRNDSELNSILDESSPLLISMIGSFYSLSLNLYRFVFLNECALCYIRGDEGNAALSTVKQSLERITEFGSNSRFIYLAYEMYENSSLKNGYTDFMKGHFREIGADILHFPTKNDIKNRSKILDLKNCQIFSAREIKDHFSFKEVEFRSKFQLEPFDEWEDLDLVSMSYALTIAHNEDVCIEDAFPNQDCSSTKISIHFQNMKYPANIPFELSVFDHSSILQDDSVIVFGGFGIEPQESSDVVNIYEKQSPVKKIGHRRFQNLIQLNLSDSKNSITRLNVIKARTKEHSINRQHSKVEFLCSNFDSTGLRSSKYLLSGGRASPRIIQSNVVVEVFEDPDSKEFILHKDTGFSRCPSRAFRHVFSGMKDSNLFVQFGGFEESNGAEEHFSQNSIWLYHPEKDQWNISEMYFDNDFTIRHSIAHVQCAECKGVLTHGGLMLNSSNFYPYFDLIDSRESRIHNFKIPELEPRYGHQMIPHSNSDFKFWILGGIGENTVKNEAILVDLKAQKIVENMKFQSEKQKTFLLQKFTVHSLGNENWITIGGGGNCFSFGTSFNNVEFL